jgi:diaminohydroxyphosphoribosylaminopyrimidine deaminase / 5-amino-6-(5-phosphoribosylamino)uracil reductase
MQVVSANPLGPFDEEGAWTLIRELDRRARTGTLPARSAGLRVDEAGRLEEVTLDQAWIRVDPGAERGFHAVARLAPALLDLLSLYLPLCLAKRGDALCFAHVGQSLDGQIATASGASKNVTGPENIRHMHRLRALSDAVVVGACTVERDDPQLTTRLVPGANPARVVIDPSLRVSGSRRVYQEAAAPTLVVCRRGARAGAALAPHVELVEVEQREGVLEPAAVVAALRQRGLTRLFVEGGGVTVSRFLAASVLDRLHVTISPIFIGAGHPGITLPAIDDLRKALRPRSRRFALGQDVLFDCQLDPTA